MPELPEVETIARGVDERVRGDAIVEVWFGSHREPFKTAPRVQARELEDRIFLEVRRVGKHIVCSLGGKETGAAGDRRHNEEQAQWIVHLGMTGRLLVTTPDAPVEAHTHARLTLKSGKEVRFVDPRRFGRLELRVLGKAKAFEAPGAEPLAVETEAFRALFRGRKLAIKAALLNQTLLAGVGNIYADESLFHAGLRPRRSAGRLTAAELERLRMALATVLKTAIRLGGSSVSDYVDANGVRGFFQLEHRVYQRTGEPCLVCQTPIKRIVVAGRSTHYCPQCQK
ncbi:MAG TPA: bifunctional DNA-formamidopyrimidine glycosylase/DNA-(apurinic or apyrimidinic site) lyase [Terracidiphilus sp.]|nr:bifunctional DNA-formamidopyrimidine glycosylase/DNA-(apurinic or apyrimidinic site) lyase [Terracidiphilus sp.]